MNKNTYNATSIVSITLLIITFGIRLSVATESSNPALNGVNGLSTYINEEVLINETYTHVMQGDYNLTDTKSFDVVFCETSKLNGSWDGPFCSINHDHIPCLPHDHECVNLQDPTIPCNMSCWHENQRTYEEAKKAMESVCPKVFGETISHIKRIRFWVDGVLKVFSFSVLE